MHMSSPVTLRSRRLGAEIAHLGAAGQGHLAAGHRALHLAKRFETRKGPQNDARNDGEMLGFWMEELWKNMELNGGFGFF